MRRIPFSQVYNCRDIGGTPIALFEEIKTNQLIRSDALTFLTDQEIVFLKDYGVKTIIDLRGQPEVEGKPNCLINHPDFTYYHIPIYFETYSENVLITDIYKHIIDDGGQLLKAVFEIIAGSSGALIYHCSAGKDRTGVVTALLLLLAGVSDLDIIADYELSFTYLLPRFEELQKTYPDLPLHLNESKREYMIEFLSYLRSKYQTVEQYLLFIGLTTKRIEELKNKMVKKKEA